MLTATSEMRFADTRVTSVVMLATRFRAQLVWRDQLLFDSRFNVPHRAMRDFVTLYLVHAGEVEVGGVTHSGPVAFVAAQCEYEQFTSTALHIRTWGEPCVALDVLLPREDVCAPIGLAHGPLETSAETWTALSAIAEALVVGHSIVGPMLDVMRTLAACGITTPVTVVEEVDPPSLVRLWETLVPFYSRWDTSLELVDLAEAAMLSSRQLSRDSRLLLARFGLDDAKFRDVIVIFRLRLACLLLSARWATLPEVATRVGYGSLDAMGRAFRDAGLPPPSEIRKHVRTD